ncbi:hypothetical protein GCM10007972_00320 [Iodidimonas muriae]|uniref:Uncharacterized protein n=1 Tax=Iodidimonas muriae TaxID=261467 RepID=A0ABQ2L5V3_9PROT|nr:hypothetical protein JCM17843_06020 [Kordiimonadales bacterium JCM 17843]GGO04177.1 hypothetical protein GCM10007972_00320 [Iodidimonas muriae]
MACHLQSVKAALDPKPSPREADTPFSAEQSPWPARTRIIITIRTITIPAP